MNIQANPRPSTLVSVHAIIFTLAVVLFLLGTFTPAPQLLLVSGPCFVLSGVLVAFGSRITLRGRVGALLRAALGPAHVRTLHMRAALWVLAGILVTVWGIEGVRRASEEQPSTPQDPIAARTRPSGSCRLHSPPSNAAHATSARVKRRCSSASERSPSASSRPASALSRISS